MFLSFSDKPLVSLLFSYKVTFTQLRGLKTEIEHLQHLLERSRLQMQKDFEIWWAEQAANIQVCEHLKFKLWIQILL